MLLKEGKVRKAMEQSVHNFETVAGVERYEGGVESLAEGMMGKWRDVKQRCTVGNVSPSPARVEERGVSTASETFGTGGNSLFDMGGRDH